MPLPKAVARAESEPWVWWPQDELLRAVVWHGARCGAEVTSPPDKVGGRAGLCADRSFAAAAESSIGHVMTQRQECGCN